MSKAYAIEPSKAQERIMSNLIVSMHKAAKTEKRDQLRVYFKQNFKRDKLPGEVSLPVSMFSSQLHRNSD